MTKESTRSRLAKPSKETRGNWFYTPRKRKGGKTPMMHLMSSDKVTFCGRHLKIMKPAHEFGPWDPEDHLDCACPRCLLLWRALKPRQTASSDTENGETTS